MGYLVKEKWVGHDLGGEGDGLVEILKKRLKSLLF